MGAKLWNALPSVFIVLMYLLAWIITIFEISKSFNNQNKKIEQTKLTIKSNQKIKETHHYYKEILIMHGDTNITFVDSVTFE